MNKSVLKEPDFYPLNEPGEMADNDDSSFAVIAGQEVIDLLVNDYRFQKSWDALFESCPWATVFQSRPFVAAWYRAYRGKHLPVLVKAEVSGELCGLLPMTLLNTDPDDRHISGKGSKITGAGHYEAQYQTWLTAPAYGETFIQKALDLLMKQFRGHTIAFRFLPPGTPLDWLKQENRWRRCSIVQSYTRPLIDFNDPGTAKLFNGKHFRRKMKRVKRMGEFQFEQIRQWETFESSLRDMSLMYDFRFGAQFNKNPFREEPAKRAFLLELFRLKLLHVTVMKVGGKMAAANVAVAGKNDWVHLAGINCHSPFKARWYSPGFLHFIQLSKQLSEKRIQYFDLTPGYDSYKEKLANRHDEVKELLISTQPKFRIKRRIRKWVHARLIASGIRPMTAELKMKKYIYLLRHWSAGGALHKLAKSLTVKRMQKRYLVQPGIIQPGTGLMLQKDSLADLLEYKPGKGSSLSRWKFLADCMRRFEYGQHAYSLIENGNLLYCAWLSFPGNASDETNTAQAPENVIELENFYCRVAVKDQLPAFVNALALDAISGMGNETGGVYLHAGDPLICEAMEAAGFVSV